MTSAVFQRRQSACPPEHPVEISSVAETAALCNLFNRETGTCQQTFCRRQPLFTQQFAEPFPENPADASGSAGGTQFQQSGSIFQPNVPDIFPFQEMFDPFPFIFHASFPFGRRFRHSRRDQFTVCLKCAQGTRQVWQIFRRNSADFCLQQQFCRIPFLRRGKGSGKNTATVFHRS